MGLLLALLHILVIPEPSVALGDVNVEELQGLLEETLGDLTEITPQQVLGFAPRQITERVPTLKSFMTTRRCRARCKSFCPYAPDVRWLRRRAALVAAAGQVGVVVIGFADDQLVAPEYPRAVD